MTAVDQTALHHTHETLRDEYFCVGKVSWLALVPSVVARYLAFVNCHAMNSLVLKRFHGSTSDQIVYIAEPRLQTVVNS